MVYLLVMEVLIALGAVGALDSEGGEGGGEERKGNWRRPRRSWRCGTIWERGPPLCACNPNQAQPWAAILEMSLDKLPRGYLSEVVIEYYSMSNTHTLFLAILNWLFHDKWMTQQGYICLLPVASVNDISALLCCFCKCFVCLLISGFLPSCGLSRIVDTLPNESWMTSWCSRPPRCDDPSSESEFPA